MPALINAVPDYTQSKRDCQSSQDEEDENAEADKDMEEGKLAWAGGRREAATYDAGEEEDVALQKAAQAATIEEVNS